MTGARLAHKRELKISEPMTLRASRESDRRVNYQAADIMHWVVAFKCIAGNVINARSNERFAKFPRESNEEIEIMIEDGCICGNIREASINGATFRASLIKYLCG